ncbi:MAG: ATP-dependent helicase [Chloroflexota bacterium]
MALKLVKGEQTLAFNEDTAWLDKLNQVQRQAVEIINGPVLIVAGAGSGKTRVITARIAYFLQKNINPYNILALTFTNKAAAEMKERIAQYVGEQTARKIWAGTFHSIFARLLREHAEKLGFTTSFTIYDQDDSVSLIKKLIGKKSLSSVQIPPSQVKSIISKAKNDLVSWMKMADEAGSPVAKQISYIYKEYDEELRANNAMDFDDLLINMITLLQNHKEVLRSYQERFKFIFVDEYQDTNRAQYIIINLLAKAHQNICVVGDDAQSIYKWRGADIRNILDFQKDYPTAKVIRLEQNYRSTKTILAAADCVIRNNKNQIPKKLWTDNFQGDKIEVWGCEDDRDEAFKVVDSIKILVREGKKLNDFAVLYRTNAQSLSIENALRKANIPYVIVGGTSFYKRKEIRDALAYLKLIVNPADSEALLRIVNEPPRGIGQTSLEHIRAEASRRRVKLLTAFAESEQNEKLQTRAKNAAKGFFELINKYCELKSVVPPHQLLHGLLEESGLLDMYREIESQESQDRLANLQQLLNDITFFVNENPEGTLEEYVQQISLASELDDKDITQNKITLMTLHSAKGLEFPIVFITGMEKGIFPLSRNDYQRDEEEEERRLFYVGITRAKEKLMLTHCARRMRFGEIATQLPSSFLYEIDKDLVSWKRSGVDRAFSPQPTKFSGVGYPSAPPEKKKTPIFDDIPQYENYCQIPAASSATVKIGDKVRHAQFGAGKVMSISGNGNQRKALIQFDSVGRKQLMLAYARLEIVG